MKKLLLTGASGFLGYNICRYTQANWEIYGTYYTHKVNIDNVTLFKVDITDIEALQKIFGE